MALQQTTLASRVASHPDLVRALVVLAAVIALLLVATAIFGVQVAGPSYDLTADPAGLALPF